MANRSPYATKIEEILTENGFGDVPARRVEAFMRVEIAPTLDGLSTAAFDAAVLEATEMALDAGPEMADALAETMGL